MSRGGSRHGSVGSLVGQGRRRAAGVSLGTVSNVLNRPERVSARDPDAGRAGDGRPRLRPQRVGPAAARRPQPDAGLRGARRHATRSSPTSPQARGGRRGAGLSLFLCNSDTAPTARAAYLDLLEQQRVQGVLITPVDPRRPTLDDLAARGTPRRARRPARARDSARSRSTTCSAAGSRSSTSSTAATSARLRRRADTIGQVRDRLEGARRAWARRRPAGRRPDRRWPSTALDRRRGPGGRRRLAGLPAGATPDRGLLRQRPARPRPAPAGASARASGCPRPRHRRVRRHRLRRGRRRAPDLRAPAAAELGRTAAELLLEEAATPTTSTSRSSSTPSSWPAVPRWAEPAGIVTGSSEEVVRRCSRFRLGSPEGRPRPSCALAGVLRTLARTPR